MDNQQKLIVGITGGIGSGKSRVCQYLAEICHLPVVNLDIICKDLLAKGAPGYQALQKELGEVFFTLSGELDRVLFRTAIFSDRKLRQQVNSILHPLARQEMLRQISGLSGTVLIEIPLLFEAGWQGDVDYIVVVYADDDICCQRIVQRDSVVKDQAVNSIAAQHSLADKARQADVVIDNSGHWVDTCHQVNVFAKDLCPNDVF